MDEIASDHAGVADGSHQNLGSAADRWKIARLGVTNRHRGIGVQQQHGHRFADDVAASHHHGIFASHLDAAAPQDLHATGRCAGDQAGTLGGEIAHVDGMKSIHVFFRRHRQQHALGINLRRKRQLHQDAVNLRALIQIADHRQQLFGGDGIAGRDGFAVNAQTLAGFRFIANVNLGSRIASREDGSQAGPQALRGQRADFLRNFGFDVGGDFGAIEDAYRHMDILNKLSAIGAQPSSETGFS